MDEIQKNLTALWKGLSASRKVSLIASLLLSLAVLGGVVYLAGKPRLTLLYGGLSPAEANKVVEYLDSKKITYEVSDGGRAVMVPAAQVYNVRMSLASQGIPTMSDGGLGFELFDKPTFGMSDFMQRANYYRALEGELSRTIRQLDEVSNARVLIVVPEDKLFGQDHQQAKASVFIQCQPGRSLSDNQVRSIRFLVANGVEGLQPERVAVVDSTGKSMAESDDSASGNSGPISDKQREARANLENYLQEKAQSLLDQVLGPGQAVVRISSDLDFSSTQETSERYDPKNAAITQETSQTETSSTNSHDTNAAAGVTANTTKSADSTGNANSQKKENTSNQYTVGKTVESRVTGAGTIKRITVALMLNQKKGATPDAKPTPRTKEEVTSLENIVKAAVGFTESDGRKDSISTQEVAFADMFDTATPAPPKQTVQQQINNYLPYVTQGCLVLLAIGILLYFRSVFLAPSKPSDSPDSFEALLNNYTIQSNGGLSTNGHANGHAHGNRANTPAPGVLTPAELSRLIRENPDNASQALRAWMKRN